ncbi:MAG: hypothetical protein M3O55_11605 [Actinomycetota bacterium]|nr:hypothetical protein [Actinomycetota bacterium]
MIFHNDRYDEDDLRWVDQVADVVDDLRRNDAAVRSRRTPVPGTKGTIDQLILSLASAGALTSTIEILKVWLSRDKHRSVELTITGPDGVTQTVRASADKAGPDAWAPLFSAAHSLAKEPR